MSLRNVVLITVGSKPRITVLRLLNNVVSHSKLGGGVGVSLLTTDNQVRVFFEMNPKMAFLLAKNPTARC